VGTRGLTVPATVHDMSRMVDAAGLRVIVKLTLSVGLSENQYSLTLARSCLAALRSAFACRRRRLDPWVGRVGRRIWGSALARSTISCRRASASSRLCIWLRLDCALITITPVAVMR